MFLQQFITFLTMLFNSTLNLQDDIINQIESKYLPKQSLTLSEESKDFFLHTQNEHYTTTEEFMVGYDNFVVDLR